jgi:hypothetical protein
MKEKLQALLTPQRQAVLRSYVRHIIGAGVGVALLLLTDLAPQYAILIGAVFGPAVKWADKAEKDFGLAVEVSAKKAVVKKKA